MAGGLKRGGFYGLFQPKLFHDSLTRSRGLGGRAAQPRGATAAAGGQGLERGRGDVVGPVGSADEGVGPQIRLAQGAPHLGTAQTEAEASSGICGSLHQPPQGAFSPPNYSKPPI